MSDILLIMEQPFLKYSKELDNLIAPAIENDLKIKVVSVEKIPTGEFNYSYKVTTETDVLIARVFRERNSPQDGKLEWIEERLEKHNIPHAKTFYYSRENKYFPYGYMVQEFVDGMSGSTVILENHLSFEEFFNQYVTILQKIHSIKANELGKIPNWAGKVETFYESGMAKYNKIYDRLKSLNDIDQSTHEIVLEHIKVLKKYDDLYEPVLLHGDPGADNAILKKDGEMIFIDWDNSVIGSWIEEYAGMSFRGTYLWRYKTDEERKEMLERSFKNNYKGVDFEDQKLKEIVQVLHIITAYGALATHYFQHENMELYEIAKTRLAKHLE